MIAVEKPKHAASKQVPRPIMVSIFMDSINTTISGSSVTSSSNMPNKLPNSIKIRIVMQTTKPFFSRCRFIIYRIKTLMPPVFSRILNTPLIISKNTLIIMIVMASDEANTRTGAEITRQTGMPSTAPSW